jgi:outer membrane immunogenic protein
MFAKLTTTTLLALSTATAAFAGSPAPVAEAPVIAAPVPTPAPFWEGGYVGGQIGYAYTDFDFGDIIDEAGDVIDGDDTDNGFIGGITLGYLWSLNNGWYIGPEFQYDWADLTARDSDTGASIDFDEIGRLKLIAGYEVAQGQGLVYGSGGIAYASLDDAGDIADGFDGSDTNWVLGLGYDHRVGDNWTIGAEYQYHDFDDLNLNTVHLKAAYRF